MRYPYISDAMLIMATREVLLYDLSWPLSELSFLPHLLS